MSENARLIFVGLFLGIAATLVGCATEPMPEDDFKVRTVDPGTPEPEAGILLPDTNPVRWVSRRLSVPVDDPLTGAWAMTNEAVLDDLSRAIWHGNGLRVGVIPASRGPALTEALGATVDSRDTNILSYDFPEELRVSPPLRAEFFADLTIPPRPMTLEFLTRGRLRMLMASRPLGNGNTRVTLTPQHHLPRATLLPRSPQERVLDGRVFDELSIEITVNPRELLVLGFYQPPLPEADEDNSPDSVDPQESETPNVEGAAMGSLPNVIEFPPDADTPEEPDTEVTETGEEVEALPPLNLGRGLFTTGIGEDDFQFVFLLRPLP